MRTAPLPFGMGAFAPINFFRMRHSIRSIQRSGMGSCNNSS